MAENESERTREVRAVAKKARVDARLALVAATVRPGQRSGTGAPTRVRLGTGRVPRSRPRRPRRNARR